MPTNDDTDGEFVDAVDYTLVGQDKATLKAYGLDHETLIRAAKRIQGLTKQFKLRDLGNMESFFSDLIAKPDGRSDGDYICFNVPICDLDSLDDVPAMEDKFCKEFDTSLSGTASCVVLLVAKHCASMMTQR